ncbi:MAG: ribonuclease HII [Flavobacteriaceae bacterium]|nr:ribonuclease HII [Flavobacteriaceae bacterium]MBL6678969.1 ribonuclease HII [Flavobacteriaceae bacterium]|tara:strand:- start:99 stop:701 length:603 start_codon:yes stop_codon:yes gene_type:complete
MLMKKFSKFKHEAGVDEAGRGSLAGPVTAAAVILGKNFKGKNLDDSKKLSQSKRLELKKFIEKNALAYSVAFVSTYQIDKNNILNSTFEAMHKSIEGLSIEPDFILVDGNLFKPYRDLKYKCIIKGDQKYQNIAAASILAKTYRDEYMSNLHIKFPEYNWIQNKGYGTKFHIDMITKLGRTKYHRKSFQIKSNQQILQFN